MRTILIATDLSQKDEKLINRAIQYASVTGAMLHVLYVHYTMRMSGYADKFDIECKGFIEQIHNLILLVIFAQKIMNSVFVNILVSLNLLIHNKRYYPNFYKMV